MLQMPKQVEKQVKYLVKLPMDVQVHLPSIEI